MSMLHIVNGDSVGKKLQQGVVEGDIWVWREVYSHGPVFLDSAAPDNRSVRAQYLEQTLGIPQTEYIQISEAQEKSLADVFKYKEIVLWFEHDLFDQECCAICSIDSRNSLNWKQSCAYCASERLRE